MEKKVTRINKNGEEMTKNITCRLQFIDSASFINNIYEGIHKIKCKLNKLDFTKCEIFRIKHQNGDCFI